ncbi:MAG: hypothetical protein M3O30_09565 [Planctomycetota bacterium]|nr:hypothetical protein [Planctomycetota bacterium]
MNQKKTIGGVSLLGAAGAGALLVYLMDPQSGVARRRRISRGASEAVRGATGTVTSTLNDLAERARQVGQHIAEHADHVSSHVAGLADSARSSASSAEHLVSSAKGHVSENARSAVEKLGELAERTRDYLSATRDQASASARNAGKYARSYLQPEPRTPVAGYSVTAAGALALGLGAMYLLDPDEGRQRRAKVVGHAGDVIGRTGRAFRRTGEFLRRQVNTLAAECGACGKTGSEPQSRQWTQPDLRIPSEEVAYSNLSTGSGPITPGSNLSY